MYMGASGVLNLNSSNLSMRHLHSRIPEFPNSLLKIPTDSYRFLPIPTDSYRFLPIPTDSYRFLPIPTDSYRFLPIPTDSYRFLPFPQIFLLNSYIFNHPICEAPTILDCCRG
jgi:hypothetical protein